MLTVKTNPVGLDAPIQAMQTAMYNALLKTWGLTNDTELYQCYGRAYRNKKADGWTAELYKSGKDYQYAYWNDKLAALSFFGIDEQADFTQTGKVNCHLVFFVNLVKLKPDISHRADEEVRQDVFNAVGKFNNGFSYQGFELWIDNVLKEYPGSIRDKQLASVDMHPNHSFRLNYSILYDPSFNC